MPTGHGRWVSPHWLTRSLGERIGFCNSDPCENVIDLEPEPRAAAQTSRANDAARSLVESGSVACVSELGVVCVIRAGLDVADDGLSYDERGRSMSSRGSSIVRS